MLLPSGPICQGAYNEVPCLALELRYNSTSKDDHNKGNRDIGDNSDNRKVFTLFGQQHRQKAVLFLVGERGGTFSYDDDTTTNITAKYGERERERSKDKTCDGDDASRNSRQLAKGETPFFCLVSKGRKEEEGRGGEKTKANTRAIFAPSPFRHRRPKQIVRRILATEVSKSWLGGQAEKKGGRLLQGWATKSLHMPNQTKKELWCKKDAIYRVAQ